MIDGVLVLTVFSLGAGGRARAFGRADRSRAATCESLRLRVASVEMAPGPRRSFRLERMFRLLDRIFHLKVETTGSRGKRAPVRCPELPPSGGTKTAPSRSRRRIGSRWLLYIGIVAIVIGAAYFEKLAIDNRWLGETARDRPGRRRRAAAHLCRASLRARRLCRLRTDDHRRRRRDPVSLDLRRVQLLPPDRPAAGLHADGRDHRAGRVARRPPASRRGSRSSPPAEGSPRRSCCPARPTRRSRSSATTRS